MTYVMGIDFGSMASKAVILDENQKIVSSSVVMKGAVSEKGVALAIKEALEQAGLQISDIARTVSTGYGRRKLDIVDRSITEITCHARGAIHLFPECRTVIDIGGQDSKVILVDSKGFVQQFAMNDRCAAGTGQFLETLSRAMELELDDVGELSLTSTKDVTVSSMCTVFAETEVISLLAVGKQKPDILAGVHKATAGRVSGMVQRVGIREPVAMTGGVSRNIGMVRALESVLNLKLMVSPNSQIAGALGAALYAWSDARGDKVLFERDLVLERQGVVKPEPQKCNSDCATNNNSVN